VNTVNAYYFDGQSARQQPVTLRFAHDQLEVRGAELIRAEPLFNVRISAKLGSAPRLLYFSGGGHCEVNSHADFEALLLEAGLMPQSLLSRLEHSWRHALAATFISIFIAIASFYWGLPLIANIAATRMPAKVALTIDTHFLGAVDNGLVKASKLSQARQNNLRRRFDNLRDANGLPPHRLEFRSSEVIGANAFALPGGTVVVTDQLIALAGNDQEILAVLAHELGHVSERHPMRQLLQSSVVGLVMTWYLGDVSSLIAAAPTLLLETSYSRDFERRADLFAASMLRDNGIAPARLADMLEKLELSHHGAKEITGQASRIARFFSTHPDTAERIRDLRSEDSQ
jgi:Zn-dependent protease with chaperone function